MKTQVSLRFVAALTVCGLVQPLLAAGKKTEPQRKTLVAALLAVSPDALGGQLGLSLASENTPGSKPARPAERLASQSGKSADNLAYRSWKASKNS